MSKKEIDHFCPTSKKEWRDWLEKNHNCKDNVWLIQYKKNAGKATISWNDAVDEALCFGWIDSVRHSIDDQKFKQYFGKRKANGTWSKINKEKVKILMKQKLMAPAGLKTIELAKENGSWTILDEVEKRTIPTDLETAFEKYKGSKEFFLSLSKSVRKQLLTWIVLAKRPETKAKRIAEIAKCASRNCKPKQFE